MGYQTTFSYCVNAADGDCLNTATGTGYVTVTGPDGNTTVYDYQQGTLAAQSDYTGTTLTSETDNVPDTTAGGTSGGTLLDTTTADGDGNITTTSYDPAGNPATTTAPNGIGNQTATTTDWSTALNDTSCAATAQATATCSSSQEGPSPAAPGRVITPPSAAPPQGVTWTLYDTDGNQLYTTTGVYQPGATTAAYQQTTYQLYTGNSVTLPGTSTSITCTTTPPSPSLPCATINADGVVTQLAYDPAGDLTSSATPDGNGTETATTTYTYNSDGEKTSTTTPDGNLPAANAADYTTITSWNADGKKTSVTQAGGTGATATPRTTSYGYDANNNQTTDTDARGYTTTTTTYNADDQPTLVTDPDGNTTLTCYDGDSHTTQTVPPTGVAANDLTAASCPTVYPSGYNNRLASDSTVWMFNALGQKTQKTTPLSAGQTGQPAYEATTYAYDGDGNLIKATSPPVSSGGQNQVTISAYNAAGQLAIQTSGSGTPAAATMTYCYDLDGDQTSIVMPDGNLSGIASCEASSPWAVSATSFPSQAAYQTTSSYNSSGELVSTTSPATTAAPSGATTTYAYDPAGNKLTTTDPNGVTATWAYSPASLPITVTYSGSSAHSVTYAYDADGQQTGMTDATGSSSYTYDPFGELTAATNGAGQTTGYGYDADGNTTAVIYSLPSSATWASGDTVTYGYTKADVLNAVTDFTGNQIAITSNGDSLPTSEAFGSTGDTVTTSYDSADAPSAIALQNSSATLQSFSYSDAPDGRVLAETDTPSSAQSPATYTYDGQGRVASMTPGGGSTLTYSLDVSGNLSTLPTGATGSYDHDSEMTSSVLGGITTNYTYSADGQRTSVTQGSTAVASGTWNGVGQLSGYDNTAADMSSGTYDGNGLRASTSITPSGEPAGTQEYVWNTASQIPQMIMDSSNAYIYARGLGPTEQVNLSNGTITYLTTDSLGSVRGTINSSGALTATTNYDAWGNPETIGGLTAATPFGYAGSYTDPTGLIYLINRYYDPRTGQFLSVDPAIAQTYQPYGYADGNPVSNTDPTGKCWWGWKCWKRGVVDFIVYGTFTLIAAAVAVVCADVTGGVCSGYGYYTFNAAMGGASNVLQCWWDDSCHSISSYVHAAVWGIAGGLVASGIADWLGINAAKMIRFRTGIYWSVMWVVYDVWDALHGRF